MEVCSFDFIKGNGFYSTNPRLPLRFLRKRRARIEDEGTCGERINLSLHLLDPGNVSSPRVIAAFEADFNRSAAALQLSRLAINPEQLEEMTSVCQCMVLQNTMRPDELVACRHKAMIGAMQ
jgi:hypothetical protein